MTDFKFSTSVGTSITFDPLNDTFQFDIFNNTVTTPTDLTIVQGASSVTFTSSQGSITLNGLVFKQITTTNLTFQFGGGLVVGDNTTDTDLDDIKNADLIPLLNGSIFDGICWICFSRRSNA